VLAADRNILASPNWLVLANGTLLIAFSLFCFGAAV
jgi:hypothetical protein